MSTSAEAIFAWFAECSLKVWIAFSLAGNVAIFLFSVGLCGLLGYLFRDHPLFDRPQPVTRADLGLAGLAVAINTVVAVVARLPLVRAIGSSSFHAGHHRTPATNFGFYSTVWDRLFGTLG